MSAVQKISGRLALGESTQDRTSTNYRYVRVGDAVLKTVKVPVELDSLLRDGADCTLWVAAIDLPTPLFFKTRIYVVYAVEIGGRICKAIDEVRRGWVGGKWLLAAGLGALGLLTLLGYVGILFLVNAVRMSFVELPMEEMQREPATS